MQRSLPEKKLTEKEFFSFCNMMLGVVPGHPISDIQSWLEEDFGAGDVTLFASAEELMDSKAEFYIYAKEEFVLCGLQLMAQVFRMATGGDLELYSDFSEGQIVKKGDIVIAGKGRSAGILLGERVALNLASRLSGIATKTKKLKKIIDDASSNLGSAPELLETRKTTPGLRIYEKYATRLGGARNHRHGLDSGAMLKENHLRALGGVQRSISKLIGRLPILSKIEIEVSNLQEFRDAISLGADVIMLDNFSPDELNQALVEREKMQASFKIEVSGNIDEQNVQAICRRGIDYVSSGALIHKAVWVDMSLQLYPV